MLYQNGKRELSIMSRPEGRRASSGAWCRWNRSHGSRPGTPFWTLTAVMVLIFMIGGSSRADAPLLFLLRPIAILVAAYGVATLRFEHWRAYRYPFALAGAILLLTVAHLVPLPPIIWHRLPAHTLMQMIDATAGLKEHWRPLSLVPSQTFNALYSLSIPIATLVMAAQLTTPDRVRIFYVLLSLAGVSAAIGLLQAAGAPINLYRMSSESRTIEATGLFANHNHQAALLAAMIPMLAVIARIGEHHDAAAKLLKPIAIGGMVAMIVLLIVTGSRTGLALGAIAIAFALFYDLLQIDWLDRMSKPTAAGIKLALGAAVTAIAALVTVATERGLALSRLETIGADLRPQLWASIVPMLAKYQPWGSGIGSYVDVYRWREPLALLRETYSNHAHNEYLEVALTAGVPGLLLLAAAAALLLHAMWRSRRGSGPGVIFARLGGTIIVILACASITDYPLRTPLLSSMLALAATWCVKPVSDSERGASGIRRDRASRQG